LAEGSLEVHGGWHYHLRFDTTVNEAADIADATLLAIDDNDGESA
jgi:hypothetical protein